MQLPDLKSQKHHPLAIALAFAIGCGAIMSNAHAGGDILVGNCNDAGAGSLREAVVSAADGSTISMAALSCGAILLESPILIFQDDITLAGNGTHIGSAHPERAISLLRHYGAGTLTASKVTLTDGRALQAHNAAGGCIFSKGSVHLLDSSVKYCNAMASEPWGTAAGGAIYAAEDASLERSRVKYSEAAAFPGKALGGAVIAGNSLTLVDSELFGNRTSTSTNGFAVGGGAFVSGDLSMVRSTVAYNTGWQTGGIWVSGRGWGTNVTIINSTISSNQSSAANAQSAGIFINRVGTVDVMSSTITRNESKSALAAGFHIRSEIANVTNTIISGNTYVHPITSTRTPSDFYVYWVMGGWYNGSNNLIGVADSRGWIPWDTIWQVNVPLEPLRYHGSFTRNHWPRFGAETCNAGAPSGLAVDQNGHPRVLGIAEDIGAVETSLQFRCL